MEQLIKSLLSADEKILWEGRPKLGIFVMGRRVDAFLVLLAALYLGLGIACYFTCGYPMSMIVWPILFFILFWIIVNWVKTRTRYMISDKRTLTVIDLFVWRSVSQAFLNKIQRIGKNVYPGGKVGCLTGDEINFSEIEDFEGAYKILDQIINEKK